MAMGVLETILFRLNFGPGRLKACIIEIGPPLVATVGTMLTSVDVEVDTDTASSIILTGFSLGKNDSGLVIVFEVIILHLLSFKVVFAVVVVVVVAVVVFVDIVVVFVDIVVGDFVDVFVVDLGLIGK